MIVLKMRLSFIICRHVIRILRRETKKKKDSFDYIVKMFKRKMFKMLIMDIRDFEISIFDLSMQNIRRCIAHVCKRGWKFGRVEKTRDSLTVRIVICGLQKNTRCKSL